MAELFLVTGGAGFIGSHIVTRLVAQGAQVRVVDNLSTGNEQRLSLVRQRIEFINADLADANICDEVVRGVHYVLHQAAIPSVQRSIKDPIATHRANITATLNLLDSCRRAGVRRLIYAASSSAYGDTEILPKKEDMPTNPLSPYALQKLVGESYCKLYYDLFDLETVALRYFNVFGPGQDPHSEYSAVIPKFINRLMARERLTVFGDGKQSRDFTYVDNVVDANFLAVRAKKAAGGVFNVGCGARFSLNQLIEKLEKILGVTAQVDYLPARHGDVRDSLADIEKARNILGYEPRVSFEKGLGLTTAAFNALT
jgi:UDP-N-acetylglucosamine/UDP-N-acetyl-alpha-D-glucosaminouronate 4-epimerase